MADTLDLFAAWLRSTALSEAIRSTSWLWPVCEIVHFFGLSLLVGVAGFFDVRLLGLMKQVPLAAAWSLMPWAKAGFALSAATGIAFFIGAPEQYINNTAFLWKLLFLAVAGFNAAFFEATCRTRIAAIDRAGAMPRAFKVVGGLSLVSWLLVIYWGRMLPFVGNAF